MDEPREDPGWEAQRRRVAHNPVHHGCPPRQRCDRPGGREDLLGQFRSRRSLGRNLDGTGSPTTLFTGESAPYGVSIDPSAGRIYWADGSSGDIDVADLNGSGSPSPLFSGESGPYGTAVDPSAGKIYWAVGNAVRVGNLNGSGSPANVFGGEGGPYYLALLRAPESTSPPILTGGSSLGSMLSCSNATWAADLLGSSLYRTPQSIAYSWTLSGAPISGATSSTVTATSAGQYVCSVTATNLAGSTSQASGEHAVLAGLPAIPGEPTLHAKVKSRASTARFTFQAGGATGFQCALTRRRKRGKKATPQFASCMSPKVYKHPKPGKYVFEVRGLNIAGTGPAASKTFNLG
jgi:hypothetical protein